MGNVREGRDREGTEEEREEGKKKNEEKAIRWNKVFEDTGGNRFKLTG